MADLHLRVLALAFVAAALVRVPSLGKTGRGAEWLSKKGWAESTVRLFSTSVPVRYSMQEGGSAPPPANQPADGKIHPPTGVQDVPARTVLDAKWR
jgi:hypothetical protein